MKRNKISTIVLLIILTAISLDLFGKTKSIELKQDKTIFISIFDSVGALPNSFAIDTTVINHEITLRRKYETIIIGTGNIEKNKDSFNFIQKNSSKQKNTCGINLIKGNSKGVTYNTVYDEKNYIFFTNVDSSVVDNFINVLCRVKNGQ